MILIDGKIDKYWQKKMKKAYRKFNLEKIYDDLVKKMEKNGLKLDIKIIDNFYVRLYNKTYLDNKKILKKIGFLMKKFIKKREGFYLHQNDNSFGILPHCLNKEFAVNYLIKKNKPILTIGAGDNFSDLNFMNLTDFQFIPKNSSIHKRYI